MKNLTTLVAVATFALFVGTIAQADSIAEFRTATVKFADLDTTNANGAAALYKRLKNAAQNVCRDLEPGRILGLRRPFDDCVQSSIANAVANIDRPAVTAYAAGRGVVAQQATIKIARGN